MLTAEQLDAIAKGPWGLGPSFNDVHALISQARLALSHHDALVEISKCVDCIGTDCAYCENLLDDKATHPPSHEAKIALAALLKEAGCA